jgi:hypothetical protein
MTTLAGMHGLVGRDAGRHSMWHACVHTDNRLSAYFASVTLVDNFIGAALLAARTGGPCLISCFWSFH